MKQDKFIEELEEAQKDPQFVKDLRKFIKITSGVYKLKQLKHSS